MQLRDQHARTKIERELQTNFLVEAGAGSGKTTSLVKRMTNLVTGGIYRVEEIAAITFTRKAAAELREKFQERLEKAYRSNPNPQTRQILGEALMNLDRCFVGTIHSFCARLLRERPVEAGVDPNFEELDEVQNRALLDRSWQEYLLWVRSHYPGLWDEVDKIGVAPDDLKELFQRFANYPEVEVPSKQVPLPDFSQALGELRQLVEEARTFIPYPPHENRYDDLQKQILSAGRKLNYLNLKDPVNAVNILSELEKPKNIILKLWLSKDKAKEYKASLEYFGQAYVVPLLQQWREHCYSHIVSFMLPSREFLADFKKRHSRLGFNDLLMRASRMLRDSPGARSYFQEKYRCLLVDEFQDTDPLQSEMMFCLTGADLKEKNWQKLSPRPGSLFVVGDPKQSIYRFRRADIETYNLVKKVIEMSDGEVLNLTTNFRCLKPLEGYANEVFEKLLAPQESRYQALFSPIDAWRTKTGETHCGVKLLPVDAAFGNKEEVAREDARQVAAVISSALQGGIRLARTSEERHAGLDEIPRPDDFLIILRYKENMDIYARALDEQRIPVSMTGGSSLSESPELKELLKLFKYLEDPDNRVMLVAVLKGLFFGFSDRQLYFYKERGGVLSPFAYGKGNPVNADEDQLERLFSEAFSRLAEYLHWKRAYPPAVVLKKIVDDLGLVPYTLAQPLGERSCSYFYQAMEYVRPGNSSFGDSFRFMVEQLETLVESGVEEELDLAVTGKGAVRLMNLHKAKGLEAPVVILAHPFKRVDLTPEHMESHIMRTTEIPQGHFSFSRQKNAYVKEKIAHPPGWDKYADEEHKFQLAEEIRLLYVAATRARNLLFISTSGKDERMKKNPWRELLENASPEMLEEWPVPGEISAVTLPGEKAAGNALSLEELHSFRESLEEWRTVVAARGWSKAYPAEMKVSVPGAELSIEGKVREAEEEIKAKAEAVDVEETAGFEEKASASASESAPAPAPAPGAGATWGILMHRALEALLNNEGALESFIEAELFRMDLSQEHLETALRELENFKATTLWGEIKATGEDLHTEVPFSLYLQEDHPLHACWAKEEERKLPLLLSGIIDLAYRGEEGWVIVDFKTDRIENEQDLCRLLDTYTPHVCAYACAWEELTGEKVVRRELYFLSGHRTYRV